MTRPDVTNLDEPAAPIETEDERDARRCGFANEVPAWRRLPQHVRRKMIRLVDARDAAEGRVATMLGDDAGPWPLAVLDRGQDGKQPLPRSPGNSVRVLFMLGTDDDPLRVDVALAETREGRRFLTVNGSANPFERKLATMADSGSIRIAYVPVDVL